MNSTNEIRINVGKNRSAVKKVNVSFSLIVKNATPYM